MRRLSVVLFLVLASCAHQGIEDQSAPRTPAQAVDAIKSEDITIWALQDLAKNEKFDVLNDLFNNHGIQLDQLPHGYSAGAAAKVFNADGPIGGLLDAITGKSWRGKIFFPSPEPRQSMGLNRIKEAFVFFPTITPMASFVTELVDKDSLVPEAKSNLVILNYAHPKTKNYWQETALTQIQVYDVMVAVQGKYGPVFIGKTWLGSYDDKDVFHADHPDRLVAWFFLDFNPAALKVQQSQHWDSSKENIMSPIPTFDKSMLPSAAKK